MIATEAIAETLRRIEANEALFDDVQIALVDEQETIEVGRVVRITWQAPSPRLGLLVNDFDDLFKTTRAVFEEPVAYYVIKARYGRGDEPVPNTIGQYHSLLTAMEIFRKAASYVDETQRELVFLGTEKMVVPLLFDKADLKPVLVNDSTRLVALFADPLHADQKFTILANAIQELAGSIRERSRFAHILRNLDLLCDKLEIGYRLFASSFSYSKIRNDVETARVDFVGKIHKTIVDIQGQLLGIPVATIVVASQLKVARSCGAEFWTNLTVLLGSIIFVLLLILAVTNQWKTLTVIGSEVERQRTRLEDDYEDISAQFIDIFDDLRARIAWHRKALITVLVIAFAGLFLAIVTFLALTNSSAIDCHLPWRSELGIGIKGTHTVAEEVDV